LIHRQDATNADVRDTIIASLDVINEELTAIDIANRRKNLESLIQVGDILAILVSPYKVEMKKDKTFRSIGLREFASSWQRRGRIAESRCKE
jgi:hypothetical protein